MAVIGITPGTVSASPQTLLRCAITPGTVARPAELAALARDWAASAIDFVQLREPSLPAGELYHAARAMLEAIASVGAATRLLVNSRADVAVASRAHGVHLTSRAGELTAQQVRELYAVAGLPRPIVGISCHAVEDVRRAVGQEADFAVFGPVFEKRVQGELVRGGSGLDLLREACAAAGETPVLALGGVTTENAASCLAAGAAGIAGIRLFGG
ncbi:thiamine-phosphate pyrophosphorylase [Bryocella elongata]|uniref:Thiamine-phosphate pyrophosphorylase n=1 Tax=Bryocella elongata TaxID=863522 RepID=A0A1H6BMB8_9BACT|nr:thiamine phosphate synthase [Bryocella elongata]SEG61858.1 thiamine-phosphate pyrophosphorylase [Bryocella elongata]